MELTEEQLNQAKTMSREEILAYIAFRASGINQAPDYTHKDFFNEMTEMVDAQYQIDKELINSVPVVGSHFGNILN
jgi:hypothetical protein